MIADFILETIIGEFVFGLLWITGYVLIRGVSGGRWQVRSYALFTVDRWPTDEQGAPAWMAVFVGALFWLSIVGAVIYKVVS